MKIASILLVAICLFFFACEKDDGFPDGYDHPCDNMLGRYEFLPTSTDKIPYEGKVAAIYVDSLDNEIEFAITEMDRESDKQAIILSWPSMEIMYLCYESQPISFLLFNDSLDISINARYAANLHGVDTSSIKVEDGVRVLLAQVDNLTYLKSFRKVLDQRTYGEDDYNTQIDTFTCFGNTYLDVEHDLLVFGPPAIFYNDTEGVVSIIDGTGKRWCFDRFE